MGLRSSEEARTAYRNRVAVTILLQ